MRVTKFKPFEDDADDFGISRELEMDKLEKVVVLAGPNGAGKSRILKILDNSLRVAQQTYASPTAAFANNITGYSRNLSDPARSEIEKEADRTNMRASRRVLSLRETMRFDTDFLGDLKTVSFTTTVGNSPGYRRGDVATHADQVQSSLGMARIGIKDTFTLDYIEHTLSTYIRATHYAADVTTEEKGQSAAKWSSLQSILSELFGMPVSFDSKHMKLGSRSTKFEELSDGQKTLLAVAAALHIQSAKLSEAILLIDEPELYLHPAAQVEYIQRLIDATPAGQVWIATHSVHILSHVDPSAIWFVEGGMARRAGRNPEKVLRGLVGDEGRIGKLSQFLQLPALHAMQRFTAECLIPPTIASTGAEDDQSRQIRAILEGLNVRPLRVLDYGAGRGRILAALRESPELHERLDYWAYEEHAPDVREECLSAIADIYATDVDAARKRMLYDESEFQTKLNQNSVHVVVMCNVLHEIPVAKWTGLFTSVLTHCLRPEGYLLVVEDMQIPQGEHAHEHGFILLDRAQLLQLFRARAEDDEHIRSVHERGGRLVAHLIRAELLANVTGNTVTEALRSRRDSSLKAIRSLRGGTPSSANGRLLALHAMLFANASLALGERE